MRNCVLLVAVIAAMLPAPSSLGGTSSTAIAAKVLNLTDSEFFGGGRSVLSSRESRLLDMNVWGVAVNAPRRIHTQQQAKLPLFMAVRASGERGWHVRLRDNCIVVGTNLNDGSVHFGNGLLSEKDLLGRGGRERAPAGPPPSGLASVAASVTELDVRNRLGTKWITGTWALGVLYYDWPSNTVLVDLQGDEPAPRPPGHLVQPPPNSACRHSAGGPKRDTEALPCYLPTVKTPGVPGNGGAFTVEFLIERRQPRLRVFGAFAVPRRDFHAPARKTVHQFEDGGRREVVAIVPVTLAVIGLDWEVPERFEWAVPVYGESRLAGTLARGYFGIDALATGGARTLAPGRYVCYLIIDGMIIGPKPLQVHFN